ncbi:MAG: peptidoglycan DD-metalloendopeptidase family protein [Anaerolineae bacterium]|nr:peptidoglycan DD-metalloendopeptidase family protein [Anaerolineae bacterium]
MSEDSSTNPAPQLDNQAPAEDVRPSRRWQELWDRLLRMGLGEVALRAGTVFASIALVLLVIWVMGSFYLNGAVESDRSSAALAAALPSPTPTVAQPTFAISAVADFSAGIPRLAQLHTNRPDRPRFEMTQYEVQPGDSVFGIAEKFGIKPQTILWGNFDVLADDPHRLQPGMKLNILPVDGVLYRWNAGDGLNGVSKFFGVSPDNIIDWPSNNLDRDKLGDLANPAIEAGTQLFVPGGTRAFISWSAPVISRSDPAKAKIFGPGYCGTQMDGYIGQGTFVWPSTEKYLSGYDFTPDTNHWGIDVAGALGNPIYASDSGVVVYSGWNDWGYGYVVVLDHGNGWQTLYAHLSQIYVGCGASVSQGVSIGAMGSTGRSSGPHLHFELMSSSGVRVNPWSYLTK